MAKFKVGDKVRVKVFDVRPGTWNANGRMDKWMGKVVTISECFNERSYRIKEDPQWAFNESHLEAEQPRREFIVIRRDGAKTIAELRHDREVIKSAFATCAPTDTFDFINEGAPRAFDRLMGRETVAGVTFRMKPDGVCKYGYRAPDGRCMSSVGSIDPPPPFQCIREKCKAHRDYKEPQPAHRFKVGDRVVTSYGVGYVKQVDNVNNDGMPYCIKYDSGCSLWRGSGEAKAAPAPEPPKFYTGKVFAEKSDDSLFTSRDGRIFEFVDGECVNSIPKDLMDCNREFKTIDEIRKQYSSTIWHEVKSNV